MVPKIEPTGAKHSVRSGRAVGEQRARGYNGKPRGLTYFSNTAIIFGYFVAPRAILGVATMYAVIATGGKQYRVQEGAVVRIEKLDANQGASVEFTQVLLVGAGASVTLGAPYVGSAKVVATVESHGKGDKVRIVKFRRRKHYKREGTHRQPYTDVKITSIVA